MQAASPDAPSPNFVPRLFSPTQTEAQRSSSRRDTFFDGVVTRADRSCRIASVADTDEANRSGSSQTLHPLEMARKRRNVLPATWK